MAKEAWIVQYKGTAAKESILGTTFKRKIKTRVTNAEVVDYIKNVKMVNSAKAKDWQVQTLAEVAAAERQAKADKAAAMAAEASGLVD